MVSKRERAQTADGDTQKLLVVGRSIECATGLIKARYAQYNGLQRGDVGVPARNPPDPSQNPSISSGVELHLDTHAGGAITSSVVFSSF